ncbi:MAG: type II toxin-antitoxin system HicB family antitoxin, partial [Dehalococcoidia bacterium]|nr:type II toxin-antitoxin system HicB family antitoxin [Dehalococcoidia bacterium]
MKYKVVVEPQEEGGYTVYVPALPGCVSQGETVEEATANIMEAIELYLESLKERGIAFSGRERGQPSLSSVRSPDSPII